MSYAPKIKPYWLPHFMHIVHHTGNVQVQVTCRKCIGSLHTKALTHAKRCKQTLSRSWKEKQAMYSAINNSRRDEFLRESGDAGENIITCFTYFMMKLFDILKHTTNATNYEASMTYTCNNAEHLMQLICKNSSGTQFFEERRLARVLIMFCTPSLILARRP